MVGFLLNYWHSIQYVLKIKNKKQDIRELTVLCPRQARFSPSTYRVMTLWEFRGQVTRLETGPGLPETLVFHDVWVYQGCWNKGPQARQLNRHSISRFLGDRSPKSRFLELGFLWGLRGKIFPWLHPIFWWLSDNLWCSLAHRSLFSSSRGVLPFLCVCLSL